MKYSQVDWSRWDSIPDEEDWNDWVLVRKAKRAATTQTAVNRASKWVNLLWQMGYSATLTLEIACEKGYQGLEWVYENERKRGFPESPNHKLNNVKTMDRSTRDISLEEELNDKSWAQ